MKNLNELTLEEIRTKFHKLESKRNWHFRRRWSSEISEKKSYRIMKRNQTNCNLFTKQGQSS